MFDSNMHERGVAAVGNFVGGTGLDGIMAVDDSAGDAGAACWRKSCETWQSRMNDDAPWENPAM